MRIPLFLLALLLPNPALAQSEVALTSDVLVERTVTDANGDTRVALEAPGVVTPGDKLVFQIRYRNNAGQPATGFVVTNPVPDAVAFESIDGDGASVSVDGGIAWGPLASLRIAQPDGTERPAAPADVTHIRWTFTQPIPPGAAGQLTFRGAVE